MPGAGWCREKWINNGLQLPESRASNRRQEKSLLPAGSKSSRFTLLPASTGFSSRELHGAARSPTGSGTLSPALFPERRAPFPPAQRWVPKSPQGLASLECQVPTPVLKRRGEPSSFSALLPGRLTGNTQRFPPPSGGPGCARHALGQGGQGRGAGRPPRLVRGWGRQPFQSLTAGPVTWACSPDQPSLIASLSQARAPPADRRVWGLCFLSQPTLASELLSRPGAIASATRHTETSQHPARSSCFSSLRDGENGLRRGPQLGLRPPF